MADEKNVVQSSAAAVEKKADVVVNKVVDTKVVAEAATTAKETVKKVAKKATTEKVTKKAATKKVAKKAPKED